MDKPDIPTPVPRRERDIMEFYRERIMYMLAVAIVVFITPFAVLNFYQGHTLLGIAIMGVVLTFCVDGVAIHLKKRPPIPFTFLLLPTIAAIGLSLKTQGIHGALWCYPGVLLCYFVLPRRMAIGSSLALLAVAAPMVLASQGQDIALRFVISLALTIVVVFIITDVIRELQRELMDQAITDPLTGAYNRRQMEFSLDEAIERHMRTAAQGSILLIDIDHFKRINDDFGHDAGDRVLKALVLLIKNRSRKLDRLFRMGGEEFLLFLPDTPLAAAMKQAENLRARIADGALLKQRQVTVSIGVAECRRDQNQEEWIKIADNALYKAKATGRNRVICGHDMDGQQQAEPANAESDERRVRRR
ncbi:MAG: GGDEF domain-containing protein [Rhodospirillaceae bacterium]|nr:GGDEF domain-containing protein [Rhodospirillaceae bacterium]